MTTTISYDGYVVRTQMLWRHRASAGSSDARTTMLTSGAGSGTGHDTRFQPRPGTGSTVAAVDEPARWSRTARQPAPAAYGFAPSDDAVDAGYVRQW